MIYRIGIMFRMTMKVLLRNKGFLSFALLLPMLATLILNITSMGQAVAEKNEIMELKKMDSQVAYLNDYALYPIKVYDSSNSHISQVLLKELYDMGMFQIYRVDSTAFSRSEIMESAQYTAMKDRVGAVMILEEALEQELLQGAALESVSLYETYEDERFDMLARSVETLLEKYTLLGQEADNSEELIAMIESSEDVFEMESRMVKGKNTSVFLDVDYAKTGPLGNMMAVLTVAFLFTGVLILHTILQEQDSLVHTRIMLTNGGNGEYLLAKFLVILCTSFIQSVISVLTYKFFIQNSIDLTMFQLFVIVFSMGVIFNALSVCVGIYCQSVLTSTYLVFMIWVITALLGGLYFDISNSTESFQRVAMLMPQRWTMKAATMLMSGNSHVYPMLFCVTCAYLIVILLTGVQGLKLNQKE